MGQHNPCTGTPVVSNDVTFALSKPSFCIARGKETAEEIVLLTEGDQEELEAEGEDVDFVDVDMNSSGDTE